PFSFYSSRYPPHLHSFPTRRSSDLLPIAIELLSQIAQGPLTVDRAVPIGPSDIRACCTLSRHHPKGGVTLSVGELLELMIMESEDRKSTRLNSSHDQISYAVFCLKK